MEALPPSVLEKLYEAFSVEPRPAAIEACPCCMDPGEICTLISIPLREISPQELSSYASSVFLTVGAEADFRYFLPRILEIMVTTCGWWPDPEVVGRALGTLIWDKFTGDEQLAIVHYFDAAFDALLGARDLDGYAIDSWMCCASHVYPSWISLLGKVLARPEALFALFDWHSAALRRGELSNGFWDDSPKKDSFREWLLSENIQRLLPPHRRL